MRCAVLIPTYDPDEKLVELVSQLSNKGLFTLVVNDGSTKGTEFLHTAASIENVQVIGYDNNCGKGHALKLGFDYLVKNSYDYCVTADSDGQHTPSDILRVIEALEANPSKLILGVRDKSVMPPKSKIGNNLTCFLFKLLYGIKLTDTQTGLRGIPLKNIKGLLDIKPDRYEYEMEMLIDSSKLFSGILEIPIETIYIQENKGSHFHPIKDGIKIYSVLFGKLPLFLISSIIAFVIDYGIFNLLYYLILKNTIISTLIARVVSGSANYLFNKYVVFKGNNEHYTLLKYLMLAICVLVANMLLIRLLVDFLSIPAFIGKILVEIMLYFVNFIIQNRWSHK